MRGNFRHTLGDAKLLFGLYCNRKNIKSPVKGTFDKSYSAINVEEAGALLRGAIILIVTAIEVYIETILEKRFHSCLNTAKTPEDMREAFTAACESWRQKKNPSNLDCEKSWAGMGWRNLICDKFMADIRGFNNPNPKNINRLFRLYCNTPDVMSQCAWDKMPKEEVTKELERIIKIRGDVVHRGKRIVSEYTIVSDTDVGQAIVFAENIIRCFENAV